MQSSGVPGRSWKYDQTVSDMGCCSTEKIVPVIVVPSSFDLVFTFTEGNISDKNV